MLNLAVIGLGRGATLTVPAFAAHPRIHILGGFDPSLPARAGFAARYGGRQYPDFGAVVSDDEVDALYIASPHEYHAEQAIAAALAGKHVLVEKPIAVALSDAHAMVAAARRSGTTLLIGPSHGYDPPVTAAASMIASGAVGAPRFVQAFAHTDFLYRPRRPAELDAALGGGVVLSQATHQIDIVRRLIGAPIVDVRAWTGGWDAARGETGAYSALLRFANGAAASLTYSGYARFDSDALAGWAGELGWSKAHDAHATARATHAAIGDGAKSQRGFAGPAALPQATHHERFGFVLAQCELADIELRPDGFVVHGDDGPVSHDVALPAAPRLAVADAIVRAIDGEATGLDGEWGLHSLAACHAILRSSAEGRDVAIAELLPS